MAGNPFYEGITEAREELARIKQREAQAVALRASLAETHRSVAKIARRYDAIDQRAGSESWERVVKVCQLIGELESIDRQLSALHGVASLPYRAAVALLPQLTAQAFALVRADPDVQRHYGHLTSDPYGCAARIVADVRRGKPKAKRTSVDPKGIAADYFASTLSKPNMRTKEARSLVAAPAIKVKSGAAPTLSATLSSDAYDLEHDRFTVAALQQMREHLKGRLCFIGHKYIPPEDVFGSFTETSIVKRNGYNELDATIKVATDNPRAMAIYSAIKAGHRHGMSVGVLVNDSEPGKEKGQTDITSVIGLEASVVGIPANQASGWTRRAD